MQSPAFSTEEIVNINGRIFWDIFNVSYPLESIVAFVQKTDDIRPSMPLLLATKLLRKWTENCLCTCLKVREGKGDRDMSGKV